MKVMDNINRALEKASNKANDLNKENQDLVMPMQPLSGCFEQYENRPPSILDEPMLHIVQASRKSD